MNKKGSYLSLIVMLVVSFIVIMFFVLMTYVANTTNTALHETLDNNPAIQQILAGSGKNTSQIIDETFGAVPSAYAHLHWIVIMLIFGMAISIFYGSYKVRTEPIYFLPYILITGVVIITSAGLANAYETIMQHDTLAGTFAGFAGGNHFFLNLPLYMGIIGIIGGIILFISWATRPQTEGGYAYYGQ